MDKKELYKQNYRKYIKQLLKHKKEYYKENKQEILRKGKERYRRNKKNILERNNEYREQHRDELIQYSKDYFQKNKGKWRKYVDKYRVQYPERRKAGDRVIKQKFKDDKCSKCGSTKNLHFHHTNYEKDEGFTLCRKCHKKEHNKINA